MTGLSVKSGHFSGINKNVQLCDVFHEVLAYLIRVNFCGIKSCDINFCDTCFCEFPPFSQKLIPQNISKIEFAKINPAKSFKSGHSQKLAPQNLFNLGIRKN